MLLIVSAFWHVFAIGGRASAFGDSKETSHAMLHWQSLAHHHRDDGSVTQDSSDESVQHVVFDDLLNAAAVWFEASVSLPPAEAVRPIIADEFGGPWPHLAGPRRPPRPTT